MIKGALDPNWYKVTLPANIRDWVFQVLLWPSGLDVGLWEGDSGMGKPGSIPSQPITVLAAVTGGFTWVEARYSLGWNWTEPGGSDEKKGGII